MSHFPKTDFHDPSQRHSPMEHYGTDLMERDTAFVYAVIMSKTKLNEPFEEWSEVPMSIRCSFQEHALDNEATNIHQPGSRYFRIFTRHRNAAKWHDKIIVRGIQGLMVKASEHFDNITGQFNHTSIRAIYLEDAKNETKQSDG